ncbi:glycosyltransferase [Candidatus Woesebacteria bacterium]|nr:glycosyltransferase [Candidatus Woesebacteria bacterium]
MEPFFSIVIHTLNEEGFVGGLMRDLTQQSFTNFEVIHVDGQSEDETCSVVSSFSKDYALRSLSSDYRNVSYQKNLGAESAKGAYVLFIDADTRLSDTNFLSTVFKHCTKSKCDMYLPHTTFPDSSPLVKVMEWINNLGVRFSQYTGHPLPSSGLMIFNRLFFLKLGGYTRDDAQDKNGLFVEDQEIMQRAHKLQSRREFVADTSYVFSLRRFHKEGWLNVLGRVLMATVELVFGVKVRQQQYEMGGQHYKKTT